MRKLLDRLESLLGRVVDDPSPAVSVEVEGWHARRVELQEAYLRLVEANGGNQPTVREIWKEAGY